MNTGPAKVRSILLIDDDEDDFDQLAEAFKVVAPHIHVQFVNKCEDTQNFLSESIDLVLLDINMPRYDGFYCLKAIREHGYKDLPIVMYTNSTRPAHIVKAYDEGANLFFPKPESFSGLMSGLKKLVELNWSDPSSITEKYRDEGNYGVFKP